MKQSGVYLITNKTTGKQYVGRSKNLARRFAQHKKRFTNYEMCLDAHAGHEFTIRVLQYTMCYVEYEAWWIEFFDTMKPNGYNICRTNVTSGIA